MFSIVSVDTRDFSISWFVDVMTFRFIDKFISCLFDFLLVGFCFLVADYRVLIF